MNVPFDVYIPPMPLLLIAAGSALVAIGVYTLFAGVKVSIPSEVIEQMRAL